ncbi:MAG: MASE1 domain-containing protein, partial [Burkholderiales bacterium]
MTEARLVRPADPLLEQLARVGSRDWAIRVALVLVAYVVCGYAGLATLQSGQFATLIWPATGIAIAALLRFGLGMWPGVWIGSFIVESMTGAPWWAAALIAFGNTLGPTLAAWVLHRDGLHPELDRRHDLWLFGAVGIGFAMLVTASNGAFWLAASGVVGWVDVPRSWATWWLGDAVGALVVGVPLLTLSRESLRQAFGDWRWAPTGMLALSTLASAALAAAIAGSGNAVQSPLFFVPHLLLCWMAARSGLFAASATAMILITGTVVGTLHGLGPFLRPDTAHGISMLVGYFCSLLAIPLLTTALTGEIATNERRWQLALDASHIGIG